jgi:hypothetical protein
MWVKIKDFVSKYFFVIALIVGILPISVATYVYYDHFHGTLRYGLSGNQSDWGTFGDFVGGMTNPIYAFFAFVGVSFTLILQRDQNEIVRQHKKQEELQSMIQSISATLHAALYDTKVKLKITSDLDSHSVFLYLQAISDVSLRAEINPNGPDAMVYRDELATVLGKIGYDLAYIQEQLELIIWCLRHYISSDGSQEIVDIYKTKYSRVAFMMYQIEYLHLQDVKDFFQVDVIKRSVIEAIK